MDIAGGDGRDASGIQYPQVALVQIPANQWGGIQHDRDVGKAQQPVHELRMAFWVVPGRPQHNRIELAPPHRLVIPHCRLCGDPQRVEGG